MDKLTQILAKELAKPEQFIQNVIDLIDDGNTIPFIARYRKEAHGAMDDTTLRTLEERLRYLRNLDARREEVLKAIESQGKLTEELTEALSNAVTLSEIEDIYRPFKQKRRTRATIAKEKGLEPLALAIYAQPRDISEPAELAAEYVDEEKGVSTVEEALAGASDIIAEMISDSAELRKKLRELTSRRGVLHSSAAKEEDSVYALYYDFSQSLSRVQREVIMPGTKAESFMLAAVTDGYERLLKPSMENEMRAALTDEASEGAIHNFALNLKPLLMQPPVKGHVTMGLDPGYRMGCRDRQHR